MLKKIHHVGIVVRDLEAAYRFYRDTLGLHVHKTAEVKDQGVKAALLTVGHSEIELLEPIDPKGTVARFLEKRGEGMHHVCFETDDVEKELAGMICFLHPRATAGVLIEYAQPVD
jgi:methylmalonyl-CoA/ethylmalonyl-CoA epimerase